MKRKKKPLSVDAILTADWHLREDTPVCRIDDFEEAQWEKVVQVRELQKKHKCLVLHAGDLFHHWKPSPKLLTNCIRYLPDNFYTVFGNHDLPQHSLGLRDKSGVTTLVEGGHIHLIKGGHWGEEPTEPNITLDGRNETAGLPHSFLRQIYVWHKFVYTGKPPFPGAEKEATGHWLLDKYPDFDLILTGDNHQPFVCKEEGRLLVNPGSLTRQTADQISHKPRVYLYNSKKNKVKPYYLDIQKGTDVVSRQHIEQIEERDERITAFVERLGTEWEGDLDFRENLKRFERENDVPKETMSICYKALDGK